jgi:hypothetical protein
MIGSLHSASGSLRRRLAQTLTALRDSQPSIRHPHCPVIRRSEHHSVLERTKGSRSSIFIVGVT